MDNHTQFDFSINPWSLRNGFAWQFPSLSVIIKASWIIHIEKSFCKAFPQTTRILDFQLNFCLLLKKSWVISWISVLSFPNFKPLCKHESMYHTHTLCEVKMVIVTLPSRINHNDTVHEILIFTDLQKAFIFFSNDTKIMQNCLQVQKLLINQSGYHREFHSEKLR